jgi:hypothetical protein
MVAIQGCDGVIVIDDVALDGVDVLIFDTLDEQTEWAYVVIRRVVVRWSVSYVELNLPDAGRRLVQCRLGGQMPLNCGTQYRGRIREGGFHSPLISKTLPFRINSIWS